MIDHNRFTRDEDGEYRLRTDFYITEPAPVDPELCPYCGDSVDDPTRRYHYASDVVLLGEKRGWHERCVYAEMDQRIVDLNDAREIALNALSKIPGMGPDWDKAHHVLCYIDRQREPILKAMLADPEDSNG